MIRKHGKKWNCAKEIYDNIDVLKLKTLNENIAEVRECLKSYNVK